MDSNSWWEARREPVQLALEIPIGPDSDSPKPPKVRRTCFITLGALLIRILGLAVAAITLAYGAWTFYQVPKNLSLEPIVKVVAQGVFLIFIGGLALLAETRTRWTMRGCINTYILFANYLARGIIYVALGCIIFALEYYNPPVVKKEWMAGGIIGVGVLNILFYPFYWKHERAVDIYQAHAIAMEPYPEEIIYGMDTLYIKKTMIQNQYGVFTPPLVSGGKIVEGANEVSPPWENQKEKETPGGPESIHIVVEPAIPPTTTTSTTNSTCAEALRHSTNTTTVVDTVPSGPIGVGAS